VLSSVLNNHISELFFPVYPLFHHATVLLALILYSLLSNFSVITFIFVPRLGYGLDDRGSRVRFPGGLGIFLFTTASRTVLGPTPSYPMGTSGVKRPGREADHSPPSSADVKECVELYPTPPIRLHGVVLS
jgi:hypothetical protein